MSKNKTSLYLSEEAKTLLKKLAEKNDRSASSMLEVVIKDAAKKAGIKIES